MYPKLQPYVSQTATLCTQVSFHALDIHSDGFGALLSLSP